MIVSRVSQQRSLSHFSNVRYRTDESVLSSNKNLMQLGPGHCEDMHLDESLLQHVTTRDEKRTSANAAAATGPGRSGSDCGVWCEGNMAGWFPALSTRRAGRWRVHRTRWSRAAAEPDQGRTWLRSDHCDRGPDIRQRRTLAGQHLRHRCQRIGGNENSFSEQRTVSRVRERAPRPGAAAIVAGNVGARVPAGEAARARGAERRSAAHIDALASQRGSHLHGRRWPSPSGQLASSPVVRDGRRYARINCNRAQPSRFGGNRGARRNDVSDSPELAELQAREWRDDKTGAAHPGAAETRVSLKGAAGR